jgi:hypothetical protein
MGFAMGGARDCQTLPRETRFGPRRDGLLVITRGPFSLKQHVDNDEKNGRQSGVEGALMFGFIRGVG